MVILGGTGIRSLSHITKETEISIQKADKVLYLVNEPIIEEWIQQNAKKAESMFDLYSSHQARVDNYSLIVKKIILEHKKVKNLCVLLYGHPTVFAYPGIEAIRQVEKMGGRVKVLPGISAEDCLFADLRVNPGQKGCISLEATEFLLYDRMIDPSAHVVFWQIGQIGNTQIPSKGLNKKLLKIFCERIHSVYQGNVDVVLYEASLYPNIPSKIEGLKILDLIKTNISTISSLYVPPTSGIQENQAIRALLE